MNKKDFFKRDALTLNGKRFSDLITKDGYDAIVDKDPETIYLVEEDTVGKTGSIIMNGVTLGDMLVEGNTKYNVCNTIDDLKTLTAVEENTLVRVLGYYSISDGGGAEYLIKDSASYSNDGVFDITLDNGMIAKRILSDNKVNVLSLGIKQNKNNTTDVTYATNKLKTMFETYDSLYTAYFPAGNYYIWGISLDDIKHSSGRRISLEGEHTSNSNAAWNVFIYTRGNDFISTNNSEQDFITVKYISFHADNTTSDGTALPKTGKCFSSDFANEFNFNLTGVRFANFEYGWYCTKFACGGSYAKDLTLYANYCGIYIPMATHGLKIDGLHCHYNRMCCYLPAGGTENTINGFNYSPGYLSIDKDDYDEYVGIYTRGSLTIDGMYLEDYLGSIVSPEKSIAIDYECSGASTLRINKGLFMNYAAAEGEKVVRYRGTYGKNNLILTNPTMNKESIKYFGFESNKIVTGIVIDGKEATIYGDKMYINQFPPEKRFKATSIRTSQGANVTIGEVTYPCYQISQFAGDVRNKSMIIGADNYSDETRFLPTVGNWLNQADSYMRIKGYFKMTGYNADGAMKLFIKTSVDSWTTIDFEVINGEAYVPIDIEIDYYNFDAVTSESFIVYMSIGTAIGSGNTLSYGKFIAGTSYDLEFITPDDKHHL